MLKGSIVGHNTKLLCGSAVMLSSDNVRKELKVKTRGTILYTPTGNSKWRKDKISRAMCIDN